MNILLLGPIHRKKEFLTQSGKLAFVKGQGQQSWVEALTSLGHKVSVFRYTDSVFLPEQFSVQVEIIAQKLFPLFFSKYQRFRDLYYASFLDSLVRSKKLVTFSRNSKPDVIIISGGISTVFSISLSNIKKQFGLKIFLFSGVNPTVAATALEKEMVKNGIIDVVVENDRGYAKSWEKFGAKKTIVLPISSVDPKLHRKVTLSKKEKEEYGADVCFVGSLTKERQEMLKEILCFTQDDKCNLKIWGDVPSAIKLDEELNPYYYGVAFGEKMVKIYNGAKIVLNFQPTDMTNGGNMRTFEICGSGALQLVDKVDSSFFTPEKEVVTFLGAEDLEKKIRYFLVNSKEREKIALAGFHRALADHTYKIHFQRLLKMYG